MTGKSGSASPPTEDKPAHEPDSPATEAAPPTSDSSTSLRPGDEVGDVEVVELLGASTTTETWRGKRPDGSAVVVHSLRPGASERARDHFLAAAGDLSAALRQRPVFGIMPTTDVDPLAGAYVGEVSAAGTWADVPEMGWPIEQQVELMRQLCAGLQALHTTGLVHGCLEPEIIVIDEAGRPVLSNAGLVDIAAHCRETPGQAELYRAYAAPEVRAGKRATARSDVYGAGRLLHYLLGGRTPSEPDEPIPRLESLRGAPAGLIRIVRKCTALDPKERYPEAGSLLADIYRYSRGKETGTAHPEVDDERPAESSDDKPPEPRAAKPARPAARPGYTKRARAEQALAKNKARGKKRRAAGLPWSPRQAMLSVLLGLGGIAAGVAVGHATGESPLIMQLVGLLAGGCLGFAVPGFGPNPALARVLAVSVGLAVVGHVDPTSTAAALKKSRSGLQGSSVSERVAALGVARQAGEKHFPRVDLQGAALDGMSLHEVVLDGSSLRQASCRGTDLRDASLLNVDVTGADFSGAKLEGVLPGFMIGWRESRCDATTVMPAGWSCREGRPVAARTGGR